MFIKINFTFLTFFLERIIKINGDESKENPTHGTFFYKAIKQKMFITTKFVTKHYCRFFYTTSTPPLLLLLFNHILYNNT